MCPRIQAFIHHLTRTLSSNITDLGGGSRYGRREVGSMHGGDYSGDTRGDSWGI